MDNTSATAPSVPRHPIRVVAERTGLTPATLRAWERRYGAVEPRRSDGAQRLYSDEDIQRLRLIARLSSVGYALADLSRSSTTTLARMARQNLEEQTTGDALAILHEAQLTGHWERMKACRQCGYAFYDRSKNRSAMWCSMAICGNRTKNRAHYRRRTAQ